MNFPRISVSLKKGDERFHLNGQQTPFTVLNFWKWSTSDLLSNATRGILAEFIVATALNIQTDIPRDEWAAWDLTTPEGYKVEVKSSAYLQSWSQRELSKIFFNVPKTLAWDPISNLQAKVSKRQAQVYVFAVLAHQDKTTVDPLDISQWEFYVLPTTILNERKRSQHSITLPSLRKLCDPVSYQTLRQAVLHAAENSGERDLEGNSFFAMETS